MTKRRSFICATADLERFERRLLEDTEYMSFGDGGKLKQRTLTEVCYRILETYSGRLIQYNIKPDRYTKQAAEAFLRQCSVLNIHLFAHHVVWQLLESYDKKNPRMNLVPHEMVDSWRRATEDCIEE